MALPTLAGAAFLDAAFFGAAFFTATFLTATFFTAAFLAAAGFLATAFLAATFLAATFFTATFLTAFFAATQVGGRGLTVGGATMSEKHCNFMINQGNASSADLENLGEEIRKRVCEEFGISLRWEIKRIGVK